MFWNINKVYFILFYDTTFVIDNIITCNYQKYILLNKIIKPHQKGKNWGLIVNHWVNIDVLYLICKIIIFKNLETLISNKKKERKEICLKFVLQRSKRNELDLQHYNFACLLNKKYTLAPISVQLSEAPTFDVISVVSCQFQSSLFNQFSSSHDCHLLNQSKFFIA